METCLTWWIFFMVYTMDACSSSQAAAAAAASAAAVAKVTDLKRRPRNLLKQDFQPSDLEYGPRWKPSMSYQPKLFMKLQHESVTLKCDVNGRPKPDILWTKDGRIIDVQSHSSKYKQFGYSLKIMNLMSAYDRGNYSCVVSNRHGQLTHSYIVDVVVRYIGAPEIITSPKNSSIHEGETLLLECSYYSDMEAFLHWRKHYTVNGSYTDSDGRSYSTLLRRPNGTQLDHETEWIIEKAKLSDAGLYSCCVTNVYGTNCRQAFVRVNPGKKKEPFTEVPASASQQMAIVLPVVLGGCVLVSIGTLLFVFCFVRRHNRRKITFKDPDVFNPIYLNIPSTDLNKPIQIPLEEKWKIPQENLQVGRLIGQGAFGIVYLGQLTQQHSRETKARRKTEHTKFVAVKMLRDDATEDDLRCFLKEIETMKNIGSHINVIEFVGFCLRNGGLEMVTEFARYGNLRDFLREHLVPSASIPSSYLAPPAAVAAGAELYLHPAHVNGAGGGAGDDMSGRPFQPSPKNLISFAFQVARGMEYLASKNVVHRDVACRNVLVADDHVVKIADFGLTRFLQLQGPYYRRQSADLLPVRWMSPESLTDNKYTTKSDVWSFGILLWEIFSMGDVPYQSIPVESLLATLRKGVRLPRPNMAANDTYRVMLDCWRYLPQQRPTFSDLVQRLESLLSQIVAADYLPLEDRPETEVQSLSDEDVFDQQLHQGAPRTEKTCSGACRSADSQYSSWSSDHTSDASQTLLLPVQPRTTPES